MAREVKKSDYKKAAGKREVSISNTQWKKNVAGAQGKAGRLVGPKGKTFTGTVRMEDGSKAVYKDGKRVEKKAAPATAGGGVTKAQAKAKASGSSGRTQPAASKPKTNTAGAKPEPKKSAPSLTAAERQKMSAGRKEWSSGSRRPAPAAEKPKYKINPDAQKPRPQGRNLTREDIALDRSRREGPQGPLANVVRRGMQSLMNRGAAKDGQTRISGGGRYKQVYKNGKWQTTHTKNSRGQWVKAR